MANALQESGNRARRTLKKDSAHLKTRDFFKFAADMANPSIKMAWHNSFNLSNKSITQEAIITSSLLDPTYQKCMIIFESTNNHSSLQNLMIEESIESLSVPKLHNFIISHFNQQPAQCFHYSTPKARFTIDRGYLFCANRLKRKSQQNSTGVEFGLKYFHAQLYASNPNKIEINILYWIKFNENGQTLDGDFVNIEHNSISLRKDLL